jgi:tRNA (guanine37-N1)-methyltransferase
MVSIARTLPEREYYTTTSSEFPAEQTAMQIFPKEHNSPASTYSYEWTEDNWREHPDLNPTLSFPTWAVPLEKASVIQKILSSELTQPFLATRDEILQQIHPRPKIVQDGQPTSDDSPQQRYKYILLYPSLMNDPTFKLPEQVLDLLKEHQVDAQGPNMTIDIQYHQFPVSYILGKLLPEETHPVPTAFETVGHVAHLNLRDEHVPYAKLIGKVFLESLPTIETVIHKVGQVSGPYRTYDYQVLAGRNDTTVKLMEHGIRLEFDLSKVYWCSRLAQERQVLLDQEIKPGQVIADAFSGVGAICLRAAQTKDCTIFANDWNPDAVQFLRHNFALNKLEQRLARASCQDAYDFLMDLGLEEPPSSDRDDEKAREDDSKRPINVVDHVLLNFPLKAPSFLGALALVDTTFELEQPAPSCLYVCASRSRNRPVRGRCCR